MPQIDRLGVEHLLRAHAQRDTRLSVPLFYQTKGDILIPELPQLLPFFPLGNTLLPFDLAVLGHKWRTGESDWRSFKDPKSVLRVGGFPGIDDSEVGFVE